MDIIAEEDIFRFKEDMLHIPPANFRDGNTEQVGNHENYVYSMGVPKEGAVLHIDQDSVYNAPIVTVSPGLLYIVVMPRNTLDSYHFVYSGGDLGLVDDVFKAHVIIISVPHRHVLFNIPLRSNYRRILIIQPQRIYRVLHYPSDVPVHRTFWQDTESTISLPDTTSRHIIGILEMKRVAIRATRYGKVEVVNFTRLSLQAVRYLDIDTYVPIFDLVTHSVCTAQTQIQNYQLHLPYINEATTLRLANNTIHRFHVAANTTLSLAIENQQVEQARHATVHCGSKYYLIYRANEIFNINCLPVPYGNHTSATIMAISLIDIPPRFVIPIRTNDWVSVILANSTGRIDIVHLTATEPVNYTAIGYYGLQHVNVTEDMQVQPGLHIRQALTPQLNGNEETAKVFINTVPAAF